MRVVAIILLPFIFSCSLFEEEIEDTAIARVKNKYLLSSDVEGIVPTDIPKEDSVLIVPAQNVATQAKPQVLRGAVPVKPEQLSPGIYRDQYQVHRREECAQTQVQRGVARMGPYFR